MKQTADLRFFYYGICHGMRIVFLQTGGRPQHLVFIIAAESNDICDLRLRICQRASLIKHYRVGICHSFKEFTAFYGQPHFISFLHR